MNRSSTLTKEHSHDRLCWWNICESLSRTCYKLISALLYRAPDDAHFVHIIFHTLELEITVLKLITCVRSMSLITLHKNKKRTYSYTLFFPGKKPWQWVEWEEEKKDPLLSYKKKAPTPFFLPPKKRSIWMPFKHLLCVSMHKHGHIPQHQTFIQ